VVTRFDTFAWANLVLPLSGSDLGVAARNANTSVNAGIDKFIDDNKALLRRMYGELQEPKTITTVRVVRTFKKSSTTSRFRRDVLEGTLEEMLDNDDDEEKREKYEERVEAEDTFKWVTASCYSRTYYPDGFNLRLTPLCQKV